MKTLTASTWRGMQQVDACSGMITEIKTDSWCADLVVCTGMKVNAMDILKVTERFTLTDLIFCSEF